MSDGGQSKTSQGWTTYELESIAVRGSGHTPSQRHAEYWDGDIRWLSLADSASLNRGLIHETSRNISTLGIKNSSAVLHSPGTVVLLRDAGVGRSAILGKEMAVSQHFIAWKTDESKLHNRYLYQWLQWKAAEFERMAVGSTVRTIGLPYFKKLAITVPALGVQKRIAESLFALDAAISTAEKLIQQTSRRKQGLMQQLLTGRRRLKGVQGKWKSVRLGSFADDFRSINAAAQALPVLSCTKYAGLVDSLQYFNKQVFSENTTTYKIVKRGQFVYATNHIEEGSIGYQDLCDAALVSPMYTVFEPDAAVINHQFLYMLLKTEAMRRVFEATTHSSVDRRGSLRWPEFAKLKINIPPMPEQERIVEVLSTASHAVDLAKQQLDELKAQKRALMQKLLSGEWRVPEAPAQSKPASKKGLQPLNSVRKELLKK